MRYFNKRTNKYFNPIINLDKLWTLVGEEARPRAMQYASYPRQPGVPTLWHAALFCGAALHNVHGPFLKIRTGPKSRH